MNQTRSGVVQLDPDKVESLAERMDGSIGEASSVMGAVLTELIRRTLRGGVAKIGEEMDSYVVDCVGAAIANTIPAIERTAEGVADRAARIAAAEVAREEGRQIEERAEQKVRALEAKTEEVGRDLSGRIEQVGRKAEEETASTARELSDRIREAAEQVTQAAFAEIGRQVEELRRKGRRGTAALKARLEELAGRAGQLHEQLEKERRERQALVEALEARVAELERPKGLRALWHRLFKRKKK